MTLQVAPLEAQVFAALRTVLAGIFDAPFKGKKAVTGTTLTVSSVDAGAVQIGMLIYAPTLSPGTTIRQFLTGRGGTGTYQISQAPLSAIPANTIFTGGCDIVRGQVNRVAAPAAPNYAVCWPGVGRRLGTNTDSYSDAKFVGAIANETLTVSEVDFGTIRLGALVFGVDLPANTRIIALGSGSGGVGTYTVAPAGQTITARTMAAGDKIAKQPIQMNVQIDVHGPASYEAAMQISTLFRDDYGTTAFAATGYGVAPLYADDPRQVPFLNDQQQYEERWVVEACIQINSMVSVPQQFADTVTVGLIEVDTTYPPT